MGGGMGRGIKLKRYDAFLEENSVTLLKDDRRAAERIKNKKDLEKFANKQGGAIQLELWDNKLVDLNDNFEIEVNQDKVKARANELVKGVTELRYNPHDYWRKSLAEEGKELGVSERQAINLENRESQVQARAVLLAARVGKVKISPYETGVLKKLAYGRVEDVVWGEQDTTTGRRQYQRGRYFTELGFAEREKRAKRGYRGETTEARRDEQRRNFAEFVTAGGRGGMSNARPFG